MLDNNFNYKTPIKKLIINQFGAALLGIMLFMASGSTVWLTILTSVFSIIFYMAITYSAMWDIGTKDRVRFDGGRIGKDYFRITKAALFANIPNIILGLICVLFTAFDSMKNSVVVICRIIINFWESMYAGILWYIMPKTAEGAYAVVANPKGAFLMLLYLAIIIPSLVFATLGYMAGFNNIKIIKTKKSKNK